jgi:lysophospholipase L1-like esterase
MIETAEKTEKMPAKKQGSNTQFALFVLALAAIVFNGVYIPNIHFDKLNVIPLLATLYIAYALVALNKVCGHIGYIARATSDDPRVRKPFGSLLFSPWLRSMLLLPLLLVAAEFGLRCVSYHRSEKYERHGDLLYTPIPNQDYVEKISLTPSHINNFGLRGGPVDLTGKHVILCLGDSVTYGYGVNDEHTYPAELQKALDQKYPGRFAVLNGGVDGYPIPFIRQKFLYLWDQGIHPDMVLVGYSFNEGGLGHLVDADQKTKDLFAARVRMKNQVRGIALYNLIVENWARTSYNKMKKYMVPGTNSRTPVSAEEVQTRYQKALQDLYNDLTERHVQPVFVLFTGFDGRTGQYDIQGPFQVKFRQFVQQTGSPLVVSSQDLLDGEPAGTNIQKFFIDQCHMNAGGTKKMGQELSTYLPTLFDHSPSLETSLSANSTR